VKLTKLDRLNGYSPRETCVALLSMLAILLFASASAVAQNVVVSQQFWGANETNSVAPFSNTTVATSGGNWGPDSAGGHSAALNSDGVFVVGTSYGNFAEQFTNQGSVMSVIGNSTIAPGGMAIDNRNYLYISGEFSNVVYKVPMNTTINGIYGIGTYGPINSICLPNGTCTFAIGAGGPTGQAPPACAGDGLAPDDAGICQINLGNGNYGFSVASIAVDSHLNLFFTTDDEAGSVTPSAPYSVFECGTSCLYPASGTTPLPVKIFSEPAGSGGQLYTGGIAVDTSENVYFTDSFISNSGPTAGTSTYSDLYQAVYNSSTNSWATTPTLLATLTPTCSSCNDAITTVALDSTGNIYFGSAFDGVFKIANNGSTLAADSPVIPISGEGVKTLVPDGNGNFYFVNTNPADSNDTVGFLAVGAVAETAQATSTAPGSVSNVSAVDADAGAACTGSPVLTLTENTTTYGFSGVETTGTTCVSLPFTSGAGFPVTVTFSPSASEVGAYSTTMTATNSADGHTGTTSVTGTAAAAQTITVTEPTALKTTVTFGALPVTLEATASSGLPVVFTTTTPTVCTGLSTDTVTFIDNGTCTIDANQPGNVDWAPAPQVVITYTVSAATQTLKNCMPSTEVYTTAQIPLCASSSNVSSSAAPICFSFVSGPGSVSGTCEPGQVLTLSGTGKLSIDVSQAASAGYKVAGTIDVSITVTSAPQTITFTNPAGTLATDPAGVPYGTSLTLAATGGASGKPVTFALDPATTGYTNATTSTVATLSGTNDDVLTVNSQGTLGTIVIDANQVASDTTTDPSYTAAPQAQAFFVVTPLGVAATPVISPNNGSTLYLSGGANTITITEATTGPSIYYTTDGSAPIVNGLPNVPPAGTATLYAAPFTLTTPGPVTVNAMAIGAGYTVSQLASATYTVSTTAANFTASVAPATVTVSPSSPGIVDITVTPEYGFNSATTFTCSTVPSSLTCSFNPATVTPTNGQSASTALTLTESGSAALERRSNPFLPAGATLAIAVCFLGWKKRRALVVTLVLIVGAIGVAQLSGCGGNGSAKATTSNVVITATSGNVTQTIQLQVTVNP
jgi:Chitobiase/beta-hexosaminidase C-terminal domain